MEIIIVPTKTGKGYKTCINDIWIYTSKQNLTDFVAGEKDYCKFKEFQSEPQSD